jgi:cell division protein ZapA (FtsZ GTPase activity inhibitor)
MTQFVDALEVTIRGRTFRLNAPAHERDALADAIAVVQARCDDIARKQSTADTERVLLLAALELAATAGNTRADENTLQTAMPFADDGVVEMRLSALRSKLVAALTT